MTQSHKNTDQRLIELGEWLRAKPPFSSSQKANGHLTSLPVKTQTPRRPLWRRPGWGIAACLVVGIGIWCVLTAPESLTYADVQRSLDDKPWVMIRYDSGAQEWINLRERRNFYMYPDDRNFNVGMRDHTQGLWRVYHSNWGRQIHEESFTPHTYPQTPWEYAVGGWDSRGPSRVERSVVERSPDTINGRKVIRFDTHDLGPSDLRVLARTVWADPQTRLPVRIRKYKDPRRNQEPDTGDFSFPQTGPSTIYDLNAPRGLPVVTNWGVIEPAAQQLIDTAKQKQRQFPTQMRVIDRNKFWLTIRYRWGRKLRKELYGHVNESRNDFIPLEVPDNTTEIRDWARKNLSLLELAVFDGSYRYEFDTADGQAVFENTEQPLLCVESLSPDSIHVLLRPLFDQWPYVSNVGPMRVLPREPGLPPGCVLLRYEGLGLRRDWIVDAQRDNVCLRNTEYGKSEESDAWTLNEGHGPVERTDWVQLPTGQWYTRTIRTPGRPSVTTISVDLMTEDDVATVADSNIEAFFSGEKLIQQARQAGAKITFWAR